MTSAGRRSLVVFLGYKQLTSTFFMFLHIATQQRRVSRREILYDDNGGLFGEEHLLRDSFE